MNVAILETCADGHHLVYVRHLATAVTKWSWVTVRGVESSPEYQANLAQCPPAKIVFGNGSPRELLELTLRHACAIGADRVIIPDGDRYMLPLLLRSLAFWNRLPFSVFILAMRTTPRSAAPADWMRNRLKAFVASVLARRPGVIVGFLTDAFGVVVSRPGFGRAVAVPDPVDQTRIGEEPPRMPAGNEKRTELTVGVFG